MTYPSFNNGDKLKDIRLNSLNPVIAATNTLEANRGEVKVDGDLHREVQLGAGLASTAEEGHVVLKSDMTKSAWKVVKVGLGESPISIESVEQLGKEYEFYVDEQFSASCLLFTSGFPEGASLKISMDNDSINNTKAKPIEVTQFVPNGNDHHVWYVKTPTVFTLREGMWRADESGQMMHLSDATSFSDEGATIQNVSAIRVDENSLLLSNVDEKGVLTLGNKPIESQGNYLPLTGGTLTGPLEIKDSVFSVERSDGINLLQANTVDDTINITGMTNINTASGISMAIGGKIKFWSSGAIELSNYSAFKAKELVTKEYVDNAIIEGGGGDSYSGQGLGVPEGQFVTSTTINQSTPVGLYYNALNDGSSRGNIELNNDEGYNEFRVIIQGMNKVTRDWRIGTGTPGRYSDKNIRMGETWECRVYVDWNASSNTNFFWTKIDDGYALFDVVDTSYFDGTPEIQLLKKRFSNQSLIEIPLDLPEDVGVMVTHVLCNTNGKIKNQPHEYEHKDGMLRVHLNTSCSGLIIAELVQ